MVKVFEVDWLPCEAAAKGRDGLVVVLLRRGLSDARRAELLAELLTVSERRELTQTGDGA